MNTCMFSVLITVGICCVASRVTRVNARAQLHSEVHEQKDANDSHPHLRCVNASSVSVQRSRGAPVTRYRCLRALACLRQIELRRRRAVTRIGAADAQSRGSAPQTRSHEYRRRRLRRENYRTIADYYYY